MKRAMLAFLLMLAGCAPTAPTTPAPAPAPASSPLAGTHWTLSEFTGHTIPDDHRPTLVFAWHGRLSGSGGCNQFYGAWTDDKDGLRIAGLSSTMRACFVAGHPDRLESDYLLALAYVVSHEFLPDGSLVLTIRDGRQMKFNR